MAFVKMTRREKSGQETFAKKSILRMFFWCVLILANLMIIICEARAQISCSASRLGCPKCAKSYTFENINIFKTFAAWSKNSCSDFFFPTHRRELGFEGDIVKKSKAIKGPRVPTRQAGSTSLVTRCVDQREIFYSTHIIAYTKIHATSLIG